MKARTRCDSGSFQQKAQYYFESSQALSRGVLTQRRKILLVSPSRATFIEQDLAILRKHFDVRVVEVRRGGGAGNRLTMFSRLLRGVAWADATYSWFAENYSLWAVRMSRFLGRGSAVSLGGYEVAKLPEIDYGSLLDPKKAKVVKQVLLRSDRVLAVDDGLRQDAIRGLGLEGGNIEVLPTGYDPARFKPSGVKEDIVLTVASVSDWPNARVKGLETFLEAARLTPELRFVVVGLSGKVAEEMAGSAPSNLQLVSPVPQEELIRYYQKAKVYCQLSLREGLPNALCEAMLCECVPVGTRVQGVMTAIGDAGLYVTPGDAKATSEAVRKAMSSGLGAAARERISNMFTLEKREAGLIRVLSELAE